MNTGRLMNRKPHTPTTMQSLLALLSALLIPFGDRAHARNRQTLSGRTDPSSPRFCWTFLASPKAAPPPALIPLRTARRTRRPEPRR